jgi:hypothetical protein
LSFLYTLSFIFIFCTHHTDNDHLIFSFSREIIWWYIMHTLDYSCLARRLLFSASVVVVALFVYSTKVKASSICEISYPASVLIQTCSLNQFIANPCPTQNLFKHFKYLFIWFFVEESAFCLEFCSSNISIYHWIVALIKRPPASCTIVNSCSDRNLDLI